MVKLKLSKKNKLLMLKVRMLLGLILESEEVYNYRKVEALDLYYFIVKYVLDNYGRDKTQQVAK